MHQNASSAAVVELKPGSNDDPDGSRTAAVLDAYFRAEHSRAFRRLVWNLFAVVALVLAIIGITTHILPNRAVLAALGLLGAAAAWVAVVEWHASERLNQMIGKP